MFAPIAGQSAHWMRKFWFPSLRVAIRHNEVDDIGGDGIVLWACDGLLVEFNIAKNCNRRSQDFNAGIWPWSCDNSVFQYNYGHDNEGGFMLICNDGRRKGDTNAGNIGTIVRNNLSQDDAVRSFHLSGPVRNTRIYGNEIYSGTGRDVNLAQMSDWEGWPEDTEFARNRLRVSGKGRCGHAVSRTPDGLFLIAAGMEPALRTRFLHNVFEGTFIGCPSPADADGDAQSKPGLTGSPIEEFARGAIRLQSPEQRHAAWKQFLERRFGSRY